MEVCTSAAVCLPGASDMRAILLFVFASVLLGQQSDCISSPCSGATNFPRDLYGQIDSRPGTWGHADADSLPITFKPPAGYRVKILEITGDLLTWPVQTQQGDPPPDPTGYAGVLVGFSTTEAAGSVHADWFADNCLLYNQGSIHGLEANRISFSRTNVGRYLGPDSVLLLKISDWLNTIGRLHLEATAVIRYIFVPVSK